MNYDSGSLLYFLCFFSSVFPDPFVFPFPLLFYFSFISLFPFFFLFILYDLLTCICQNTVTKVQ